MNEPSEVRGELSDTVNVIGFGACMIGGYPHAEENSFFRLAVRDAAAETGVNIRHSVTSIRSLPVTKAVDMLAETVFSQNPDIVVFQFGSTDTRVPTRGLLREVLGPSVVSKQHVVVEDRPSRLKNRMAWFLRGCAGLALSAKAITSRADYRRSISQLADGAVSCGAYPIVFTPFIQGCFLPDAWAQCYSHDLVNDLGNRTDVCVIDCWNLLSRHSRSKILLHNGVHLTREAHALLAQSLKSALVARLRATMPAMASAK